MDAREVRTILWLRSRLTRNQWSRGGFLNAVLRTIVAVVLFVLALLSGIVGMLVGFFVLADVSPLRLLVAWDAFAGVFLLAWMIGLISEIQRSETIDIGRMLHLPISLSDIFLINYLASHLTLSVIAFLPLTLGLCVGLILSRGGYMIGLVPLVLGFVFMVSAWTYCLRGWLVTLMVNKRRRRAIIAGITFGFILITQVPYLIGNLQHDRRRHGPDTTRTAPTEERTAARPEGPDRETLRRAVLLAHHFVPFLWVGNGARSLAEGSLLPAVLGTVGGFGIGALGLRRAYRSTLRFYRGQTTREKPSKKAKVEKVTAGSNFLEKQLPGVPDEAAAMALASFRCLARAPEVKMALASNFMMLLIFGAMFLLRRSSDTSEAFKPFIATGAIGLTFFGTTQLMFNLFGYDRGGFRALALLPTPRRYVLLGKNLALLPVVLCIGGAVLLVVAFAAGVSALVVIATLMQLLAAFLLLSTAGNLVSTIVPYRVAPGSMKPTKLPMLMVLLMFVTRLLFPAALLPIFLAPGLGLLVSKLGWAPATLVNLTFSALLLVLVALLYRLCLPGLGNLLRQREKAILQVVTHEVE